MPDETPIFFYDVSSPYAYLAAARVDDVLRVRPRWQPIAFGILLRETGRVPWSLQPGPREEGMADVQARAQGRGLPEVRWPEGWPAESYSLAPLRALMLAVEEGRERELTLELYRLAFAEGRVLGDPDTIAEAARAAGLEPDRALAALDDPAMKERLREATDDALRRGVTGVPTVLVGDELFWGDDRLEDAAAALAA
jgi:2-hydroxychromene-2-carboxylate isomerase